MGPIITTFERSPDCGKGLARDMPVRWALEEVGRPYTVRYVSFAAMKEKEHLALNPFGQIPTFEEGDLILFESGAIVFHIANGGTILLPDEANARSRAITWIFAALNTIEPPIVHRETISFSGRDVDGYVQWKSVVENIVRRRLSELSGQLGESDWLDGEFSAADLLMVQVLRRLAGSTLLSEYPNLIAYVARGEDRPAFKRAFDAQLADYLGNNSTEAYKKK
ncbi:glutathione S-transferase family protein [Lacimicrobium alkaliphilum]|uniref:Glutathione S-transferase n=1 Tax=Lacimicrobium alkaliphilum TaxID=1526571 RepID=A0A0U2JIC1_9ALTE|nr:glutathione S-transferase family protein [Lacimicrobium alkaliphilum]ALS97334.1 glutathione S-transferase [Lacimicrobium alkaliphilum]